jgi:hypothetical protein
MSKRVRAERVTDSKFRTCGHGGCSSFATFILVAGDRQQCFCCAQCVAAGVRAGTPDGIVPPPRRGGPRPATEALATLHATKKRFEIRALITADAKDCVVVDTKEKARAYFGDGRADQEFDTPPPPTVFYVGSASSTVITVKKASGRT